MTRARQEASTEDDKLNKRKLRKTDQTAINATKKAKQEGGREHATRAQTRARRPGPNPGALEEEHVTDEVT